MRTRFFCSLGLLIVALAAKAQSPRTLVVDLAKDRTTQQLVAEGVTLAVEVHNQLPAADYTRTVDVRVREVPPIDLSALKPTDTTTKPKLGAGLGTCSGDPRVTLDALTTELAADKDEKAVATTVDKLRALIGGGCSNEASRLIDTTIYKFTGFISGQLWLFVSS